MKKLILILSFLGSNMLSAQTNFKLLQQQFTLLSQDTRPGCFWYWLNDNVSKDGITKDLEAMRHAGIGRAYVGHIFDRRKDSDTRPGTVKFMSEEWWTLLQWAVKEADRCNIEIGFFNGPGWSQSGGPWVDTQQSMRYISCSEIQVTGGKTINKILPVPKINTYPNTRAGRIRTGTNFNDNYFQDVAVIAFPRVKGDNTVQQLRSSISNIGHLSDKVDSTFVSLDTGQWNTIEFEQKDGEAIQNAVIKPLDYGFQVTCKVFSSDNGVHFQEITTYEEERGHQGDGRTDPVIVPFRRLTDKFIRISLLFKSLSSQNRVRISELKCTDEILLAGYTRKKLAETSPYTKIPWDAYIWQEQIQNNTKQFNAGQVIDLTNLMDENGRLKWRVPKGDWVIQRFGMLPTGTQCNPCGPESLGFEVDKMSRGHVQAFFNGMVGEFLRRTPEKDRRALKYVIADSYETGPQNWTDNLAKQFEERFGYSMVNYMPVFSGRVVDNINISNRFLWDYRKLITDLVATEYVGGLRDICNKNGLKLLIENYGHWGFISEFLHYGSMADDVSGEIWESWDPVNNIENRAAASAAHIYGRNTVYTEAFTSNRNFVQSPASLKKWCDWAYSSGANHFILHTYIHQPNDSAPGFVSWFGTPFNRHNTWFKYSGAFIDYLRRSTVLLKSGRPHADIAYYIGENAPSMQSVFVPSLPAGFDFDHINSDVLLHSAKVINGKLVLNSGQSYALMVLPPVKEMRVEIVECLLNFVKQGLIIVGSKPSHSPSLQGFSGGDIKFNELATELWGNLDGEENKCRAVGSGWVYHGLTLESILKKHNIECDFKVSRQAGLKYGVAGDGVTGVNKTGAIVFKHRIADDHEVYFLSNTTNKSHSFTGTFRSNAKYLYFFNAVSGEINKVQEYSQEDGRTTIPLQLDESESIFIVFAKSSLANANKRNTRLSTTANIVRVPDPWKVKFDEGQNAFDTILSELKDWTEHENPLIKYYSGKSTYSNSIVIDIEQNVQYVLNLGDVADLAVVYINDSIVGTVWTKPWEIDITDFLKDGKNYIDIKVINNWNNRIVADIEKKVNRPPLYISQPPVFDKRRPYTRSGLFGPVIIKKDKY